MLGIQGHCGTTTPAPTTCFHISFMQKKKPINLFKLLLLFLFGWGLLG